jgi:PKHD-type hydroxylase
MNIMVGILMEWKLSVSLQLSDESEYEGGELQFLNTGQNSMYTAPKERGTIIIFDSRVKHRVRPIKKGARKSLVAWMVGPRWK